MDLLQSKQDLEKYSPQELDLLAHHYDVQTNDKNDRLWLLAIAILSDKKYAQMIGPSEINPEVYFNIIRKLGEGTFGVVVLAELQDNYKDLQKGERVAMKLLNIRGFTQQQLEDTKREIDILQNISSLQHGCNSHIVCYYDSFITSKGRLAIIMEYIPGKDLEELIGKGTIFSDTRILQFMKTLAITLKSLHDRNIVHRDIKTGNIMLGDNDILKYIDFGFSCFTLTRHAYSCPENAKGTPVNMAPELWKIRATDLHKLTAYNLYALYKKADVWALGIVFYELLFGVLPPEIEEQNTCKGLGEAVMTKTMSFPADFQGQIIEIVKGMLVTNPDDRSNIAQVVKELNKL